MQTSPNVISRTSGFIIACLAAAALGLGIYIFTLRSDLAAVRRDLAAAQAERDGARQGDRLAREQTPALLESGERLAANEDQPREEKASENANATAVAETATENALGALAQTFATPEMRQMIQREALNDARKGYADLLKKWNLPSGE